MKRHTHKVITDEAYKAMQERNAKRLVIAKRVLGDRYILAQQVGRKS